MKERIESCKVSLGSHEKQRSGQSEPILDLIVLLTLEEKNMRLRTYYFPCYKKVW